MLGLSPNTSSVRPLTTYPRNDLRVWIWFKKPPGELCGSGVVVGLRKHTNSTAKSYLYVGWLHLTMREVRGQLQAPAYIARVLLGNMSALKLYGNPQEVFTSQCDGIAPLSYIS